ncbi:hypothetical protein D4R47_04625 [archaeon]|nr:MAG: hypothetical protein D4R47_04625 [archaeon]
MTTYCYVTEKGDSDTLTCPLGQAPRTIKIKGRIAKRDYQAEASSVIPLKGWPFECIASGVHPSQAGQLRDHLARKGVPTEVTSAGDPVMRNASHRKKVLKARHMHDRASYN